MKRPTLCIVTATRAEYGLLRPVIKACQKESEFMDLCVVVTGSHLSPHFGMTIQEIEADHIPIDAKLPILCEDGITHSQSISQVQANALEQFSAYFEQKHPDLVMVLGDRYEALAICMAAVNAQIPIAHLYGGEITQGAQDDCFRHAITKLSYLHFTSTKEYRNRVIQLGESPDRVFCVGALGIENALHLPLLSEIELRSQLHIPADKPYALLTFHPVTTESQTVVGQLNELFGFVKAHPEYEFIMTKANADFGGEQINEMLATFCSSCDHATLYDSLGSLRYLSALSYASFVIGNSSSGLIEVPSFHIPTIDIGDRQKGRLCAESVIHCAPTKDSMEQALLSLKEPVFKARLPLMKNPYGDGNTSAKIIRELKSYFANISKTNSLQKVFYDIPIRENP